jgi:monoamine oxidase
LFDLFVRSLLCCEPAQVSMLFFLFYIKGGGGLELMIKGGEGGAQNLLFHGGVHQIAARLARELGDRVRLSSPATAIEWDADGVTATTPAGAITARRAIVATPPGLTNAICFTPDLPHDKRGLLQRQNMGSCIKIWIAYDRPFWRDQGFNGMLADHGAPFTPIFDATPPGADVGFLAGFYDGDAAALETGTPDTRRRAVLQTLAQNFGDAALAPIAYAERDWRNERWSQGCYGAYMGPGTLTRYGAALRTALGPIHWAGTETAREWSGYIEGAIEAGERASAEVLASMAKG